MTARRIDTALALLLGAATLAALAPGLRIGLDLADEGWMVSAVARVSEGEALYRDIHRSYGPALYLAQALIFELFGPDLLHLRMLWIGIFGLAAFWTYRLARPWTPIWAALFAGSMILFLHPPPMRAFIVFSYTAALVSCRRLVDREPTPGVLLVFGLAMGGVSLVRQDAGVFGLFVGGATVALAGLAARGGPRPALHDWLGSLARSGAVVALGAVLAWLPVLLLFWVQGSLADAADHLLLETLAGNAAMHLPFPAISRLVTDPGRLAVSVYYLPTAASLLGLGLVARPLLSRSLEPRHLALGQWTLFAILSHSAFLSRPDWSHVTPVLGPSFLILAWAAGRLAEAARPARRGAAAWAARVALVPLLLYGYALVDWGVFRVRSAPRRAAEYAELGLPRARVRIPPAAAAELQELVREIQARTTPDEAIFVAPYASMVYFLAERPHASRYDMLLPGFLPAARQDEIVADLESGPVRLVVLDQIYFDGDPRRRLARFAPRVMNHLRHHYEPELRVGRFQVWLRREDAERAGARPPQ